MKRIIYFVMIAAMFAWSGELADKQMKKFVDFCKKKKYEAAVSTFLDHHLLFVNQDVGKQGAVSKHANMIKQVMDQHGKILNYTKWRTRSLSKNLDETVYQVNCEKSAWMVEVIEDAVPNGKNVFNSVRYVTEEDIFKIYDK